VSYGVGGRAGAGAELEFEAGMIFEIPKLRNIDGQYSRSKLLAVFKPIRRPYR